MVQETPRFNLKTYDDLEEWDHTDIVELFDELAIQKGQIGSRPSQGQYDDELYFATDQNILYQWDQNAADWDMVGGIGSQGNPLDAVYTSDLVADSGEFTTLTTVGGQVTSSPTAENDITTKQYVDSVVQGLNWQASVLDELNDPPTTPSDGDRYLIDNTPTGDWSGHPTEITEYDGDTSSWQFFVPDEGWAVFIEDINRLKVYESTDWIEFGSAVHHGSLSGLVDDDHTQYYHVDGRRALTGDMDVGGNNLTNIGTISPTTIGSNVNLQSNNITNGGEVAATTGNFNQVKAE